MSVNNSVPSSEIAHVMETVVVTGALRSIRARDGCDVPDKREREENPVPGMPEFRKTPRLPMPTDAPRGPRVQLEPDPLMFQRMPGASLIDFLNLSATYFLPDGATDHQRC